MPNFSEINRLMGHQDGLVEFHRTLAAAPADAHEDMWADFEEKATERFRRQMFADERAVTEVTTEKIGQGRRYVTVPFKGNVPPTDQMNKVRQRPVVHVSATPHFYTAIEDTRPSILRRVKDFLGRDQKGQGTYVNAKQAEAATKRRLKRQERAEARKAREQAERLRHAKAGTPGHTRFSHL
jgi:hypothetical protein